MKRLTVLTLVLSFALAGMTAPALAQPTDPVNECQNADVGPDGDGPPGFVADLTPNFISGLIGALPVPNFVKTFFGASTC
ncbi:MAG: histidine kinase [Halobacteriales archaeon]